MSSSSFNEYSHSNGVHTGSYSSHCQFDQQPQMTQFSNPPHNPARGYPSYGQFSNPNPQLQGHYWRIDSQQCSPFWDGSKSSGACGQNESVQPVEQPREMTEHASTTDEATEIRIVKLCLVCGDQASPTNKSVPTCYACQTFFRRRLEDKKERTCAYEECCIITVQSRKYCKKCRYRKCVQINEKLRTKRARTAKRKGDQWPVDDTVDKRGDGSRVKASTDREDPKDTSELTRSLVPVTKGNKEQTHLINKSESSGQQIPVAKNGVAVDPRPITHFELKYMRLGELLSSQAEWQRWPRFGSIEQLNTETVKKLLLHGIDCTLRQFRRLKALQTLPLADQRTLLIAGAHQLLVVHTVMKYCVETEKTDLGCMGYLDGIDFHEKIRAGGGGIMRSFQRTFAKECRKEINLLLLSGVMLFNPNTPNVTNKSAVQSLQHTYRQLMKDFLILTYGEQDARRAYSHLISQAKALSDWGSCKGFIEWGKSVYQDRCIIALCHLPDGRADIMGTFQCYLGVEVVLL